MEEKQKEQKTPKPTEQVLQITFAKRGFIPVIKVKGPEKIGAVRSALIKSLGGQVPAK